MVNVTRSMLQSLWLVDTLPLGSREPISSCFTFTTHLRLFYISHDPFYCRPYLTVARKASDFSPAQPLTYCSFGVPSDRSNSPYTYTCGDKRNSKMADSKEPVYAPFFGVMGAASAIIFSGKFHIANLSIRIIFPWRPRENSRNFHYGF